VSVEPVALEVSGVSVRYGGRRALYDVDLTAAAGTVTGLIGPNGAGKTTLFNVVCGLQAPSTGRVVLGGRDITRLAPYRRARLGLARTFQRLELFTMLSVRGNVRVAAGVRGRDAVGDIDARTEDALARVGLTDLAGTRVDELPTGQARLVELARALATHPAVLLLDEPASGLDDRETAALADVLRGLAADGIAVVLVEHDVHLVMRVCELVHVLDFGRLLFRGAPDEVRKSDAVVAAYLGAMEPA
jgi:branched-chain amino acid transport system ATP-binding protein